MRAFPLLAFASLCLTLVPLLPSAVAGPPLLDSCPVESAPGTYATACTFVCNRGDRLSVDAQTTAGGDQWPRLRATCGGVTVVCQAYRSCSATSTDAATSEGLGTCMAETVSVRGTCSAAGGVTDPNEALRQVDNARRQVEPYAGLALAYADWASKVGGMVAGEVVAAGPSAATMCTTAVLDDCQFACAPGDRVHVRAQGYMQDVWDVWGSASCGGAAVSCSGWIVCEAASPGYAGLPGVGTCSSAGHLRATCWAAHEGQVDVAAGLAFGAAGLAVGTALWGAAVALGAVDSASDHDRDSHRAPEEITSHSDPLNGGSRPWTDDDADGVANRDERSRLHAASGLVANALARTTSSDRVTFHFGHAGARATVRSPEGHVMTVVYASAQTGPGCPPAVAIAVPDASPCTAPPAVATFSLAGDFAGARRAHEPGVAVPASAFVVLCSARASGRCLDGVGMDGTWTFVPATQAARATLQPKAPAGFAAVLGGKTFVDVAADSGDIQGGGSGQNTRDALMPIRLWNWHVQGWGATYHACSGGVAAPCSVESQPQESLLSSRQYA